MDGSWIRKRKRKAGGYQMIHTGQKKTTIMVLSGGPSAEREVSLAGGREVSKALSQKGYKVQDSDIGPDDLSALDNVDKDGIVFPVLHGEFGEDGQLQALLEERNLHYVGSDARSSRLAMDKAASKQVFSENGLLTGRWGLLRAAEIGDIGSVKRDAMVDDILKKVELPCVIKPNEQGSSIGVAICRSASDAHEAAAQCLDKYGDCLIEQYIHGHELTVGILAGLPLPILEVRTNRPFYDYQAKYVDDDTQYDFELPLDHREQVAIQRQASRAFAVLGCRDFGRVDLMLDEAGRSYLLEINTLPGFTSHSLLPKAAGQAGINLSQMCDQIVQMAHRRPI